MRTIHLRSRTNQDSALFLLFFLRPEALALREAGAFLTKSVPYNMLVNLLVLLSCLGQRQW